MVILPGFPKTNPILTGISDIIGGVDPDQAMRVRDEQLDNTSKFVASAIEAACWFPINSPLLADLLAQATSPFIPLDVDQKVQAISQVEALVSHGHEQLTGWAHQWRRRAGRD